MKTKHRIHFLVLSKDDLQVNTILQVDTMFHGYFFVFSDLEVPGAATLALETN